MRKVIDIFPLKKSRRKMEKLAPSLWYFMKRVLIKIVCLLIIVALNWSGLSAIIETFAYLADTETSPENSFTAGILDFSLSSGQDNFVPLEKTLNLKPGDEVNRVIQVKNEGTLPFQYTARTEKISGDDDFCNALQLTADLEGEEKYSGSLMGFSFSPIEISAPIDTWHFKASLEDSDFQNKTCQIKFVFEGWQTNLPDFSLGFSDQEEIVSSFATWGIRINKVYYDVDAEHGIEYDNEWIEIYNQTNQEIDISGWKICDNSECDDIPSSDPIPAGGFALITAKDTTWDYWQIPDKVIKIVLADGRIGNGLANDGDRVILKMPDGTEVDAMSYGTDNYAFDPPAPDVEEGHILGRSPNGFDTNRASDWRDFGLPEVTVISPNGGETWYVGRTYTLQWIATNPNGEDNLLSIDIWYSRDSGKSWANIVRGTENDGAYDWRVPLFIDGYYVPSSKGRIKVVATGPENFMVQNWDMSDKDFCPPIDYGLLTPEEIELLKELGLMENLIPEENFAIETRSTTETTTEETTASQEETTPQEGTSTEGITEEESATDTEETPASLPDNDSGNSSDASGSSDTGSDDAATSGNGESTDSGTSTGDNSQSSE